MTSLNDLKNAANPFTQLAKDTKKVIEQNEIQIILLSRLCDLKEDNIELLKDICDLKEQQKKADSDWRVYSRADRIKDRLITMVLLTIASIALYLDYFRGWPVIKWLKSLIG